jgi:hypothetical protein
MGPPVEPGGVTDDWVNVTLPLPAAEYSTTGPPTSTTTFVILGGVELLVVLKAMETAAGAPDTFPYGLEGVFVATEPTNITFVFGMHEVYILSTLIDRMLNIELGSMETVGNGAPAWTENSFRVSN